jgi:hypothetical protein
MFLSVATFALIFGVLIVFSLRRWIGSLRWAIVAIFLLSIYAGTLAARASHAGPRPTPLSIFTVLVVAVNLPNYATSVRRFWNAARTMGQRLYAFHRPGNFELTWSGRAIVLMSGLLFLLLLTHPMLAGWSGTIVWLIAIMVCGWVGYCIAVGLGRVELRAGGVLRGGTLYTWAKLGRFEWMPGDPPVLRIQVRRTGSDVSDIRVGCPDDPEINAILTGHGLIRW